MEPFDIELVGMTYTIYPQENGNFRVFEWEKYIGTLEPIANDDTSVEWVTADLMSVDLAQQIGELIEEHEM